MDRTKIRITGTGCALADFVYNDISFQGRCFRKYASGKESDGGLTPGKLVFTEELEKFAGKPYPEIISELSKAQKAETFNIGGPALVSLIHAAQVLDKEHFEVDFYGISGNDNTDKMLRELLGKTPVGITNYISKSTRPTPFTHVLSDPAYDGGNGERTFINNIGAAWDLTPDELPDDFFKAQIVCFGGTALTPHIHDNLHVLLEKAKSFGALTVVNTVYDFRNEKQNPGKPWPLGITKQSLPNIDLLIMDNEEALKISGEVTIGNATKYFRQNAKAFIITRGAEETIFYSNGKLFSAVMEVLPVSESVSNKIKNGEFKGDTTGCGDNFVGGVVASLAQQIQHNKTPFDLREAVASGICSGGFTCSYTGGTYFEETEKEKLNKLKPYHEQYKRQIANL